MLISTKPDSAGKAAVLARAAQLTDFKWTPIRDIPTYTKKDGKTAFTAGVELTGINYSSNEPNDKFITENVSFETLMSALSNPDSALYQKDLKGHLNAWTYFGIVCNGLARYAYGIQHRYNTKRWLEVPGNRRIAHPGEFTVEDIRQCDSLYAFGSGRSHVALITDILRDEDGVIRQIEVSEAVLPLCKRAQYDVEEFYEKYKLFGLCRYDFVDEVPEPDPVQAAALAAGVPALPAITVDYGNKSNYLAGEEVVISVFTPGIHNVEIIRDGWPVERITVNAPAKIVRTPKRGYYTVRLMDTGDAAEFCVNQADISYTLLGDEITVQASSCDPDSELLYMDFREVTRSKIPGLGDKNDSGTPISFYNPICASLAKVEELTEEEKQTGIITRPIPFDAGNFKVYFKNKYGVWVHPMTEIPKDRSAGLRSTAPDTPGKAAVLARCTQMTEFEWKPVRDIPTYTMKQGKTCFPTGTGCKGLIYSSAEPNDKFFDENVSFETMLSIIANPDSALYHKDLNGHSNSWPFFGTVCNALVRYAYHIQRRYNTKHWLDIPGMHRIAAKGEYTAEDIRLCDNLCAYGEGRNHVAMITDILRDDNGVIRQIEVSEAVRTTCARAHYTVERFFEKYKLFSLCRYDFVDEVPNPDPEQDAILKQGVPALPAIAADYGNKSNYLAGEEVVISVFTPGEHTVELCRNGTVVESVCVTAPTKFVRTPQPGYYTAKLTDTGDTVEFCVNQAQLSYTVNGNEITVKADPCDKDSEIVYMEFRELSRAKSNAPIKDASGADVAFSDPRVSSMATVEELTEEEKSTGIITRSIPADAANFKVYFRNKYGVWVHPMTEIVK